MGKFTEIASKNWIMINGDELQIMKNIITYETGKQILIEGDIIPRHFSEIVFAKNEPKKHNIKVVYYDELNKNKFLDFHNIKVQTLKTLKIKTAFYNNKVVLLEIKNLIYKQNCIPALWDIYVNMYPHLEFERNMLQIHPPNNQEIVYLPIGKPSSVSYADFMQKYKKLIRAAGNNLCAAKCKLLVENDTTDTIYNSISTLRV